MKQVKVINNKNITICEGEGLGSCKRCDDNGKWNSQWMCFLYKIKGVEGCYCHKCTEEIMNELDKG